MKLLQLMAGVDSNVYWLSNFIFDSLFLVIITSGFIVTPIVATIFKFGSSLFFFDFLTSGISISQLTIN